MSVGAHVGGGVSDGEELVAVILAAGDGSRIRPLSDRLPKAALPVGNRPLVLHHVDVARSVGIRDVVIVVGAGGDIVRDIVRGDDRSGELRVRYAAQKDRQGIAHAVSCAEAQVAGPFVLLLSDIFMPDYRLGEAIEVFRRGGCSGVLGAKHESDPESLSRNFSIEVANDRVTRVVEKPPSPSPGLKGVGLYVFARLIFDAIRRTPRSALRGEFEITDAVQTLIDSGEPVRSVIVTESDINVNDPQGLLQANLALLEWAGKDCLIGSGSFVHPRSRLERVVIGHNVRVGDGVALRGCVVADGVVVDEPGEYVGRIFFPGCSVEAAAVQGT